MAKGDFPYGMGWLPDYPDIRDYTDAHEKVKPLFQKMGVDQGDKLPPRIDLREWCSPIENQGNIGACTAHAGVGLLEYYQRRSFGEHVDASRRFLYKTTRNLLHWTGDTGAFVRTTMKALVLFGVPPEEYWMYKTAEFDEEPPAFCYAFAQNYQAISYVRLGPPGHTKKELFDRVRRYLAKGLPAMFGFTVYESIGAAKKTGLIPFPDPKEEVKGGHAVMAVGYDNTLVIKGNGTRTKGAFLIRNSWGEDWGDGGYGWLPYKYLMSGQAVDWWTLMKAEWVDTGNFGS